MAEEAHIRQVGDPRWGHAAEPIDPEEFVVEYLGEVCAPLLPTRGSATTRGAISHLRAHKKNMTVLSARLP